MIIKRKKPDPIKSYFIEYPKSLKGNGVSFHILNEKRNDQDNFVFLLSRTEKEVALPEAKDIFATVTVPRENAKLALNNIGFAVQTESKRTDRQSYDHDIIELIKERDSSLQINVSSIASKFVTQEEKNKIQAARVARANAPKKEYSSDDKEMLKVRPYALLKTLHNNQIIDISKEEPNGDELKVKFEFVDQSTYGSKKFNISVAKLDASAGNKAQLFNDFSNQKNKALGMGSAGLIAHLGENGFLNINELSNEDKIKEAKSFFKSNILPLVPEELKMEHNDDGGKMLYFKNKTVTFQPIEKYNPYTKNTMTEFLEYRGISKETIEGLIENNNLIFGDFYNSRITVELDKFGREKPNYGYKNAPYFRLKDGWSKPGYRLLNENYGAERFEVKKTPTGKKPFEYDKKNIGSVDGKYWSYGNQHNPERAIIHEAIIDGLSSLELFKESGVIDPNNQRYFSTQGASHMKKFFQKNVGIWTESKNVKGVEQIVTTSQEFKEFKNPIDDFGIEQYKEKIGHKEIIFFKYPSTSKKHYIENNLKEMQKMFGCNLKVIELKDRSEVDFSDYKDKDTLLVDEFNYNDLLDSLKLNIYYDRKEKKYSVSTINQRFYERPLNDFNKNKIRKNLETFFGTENLVYCLDNDHAGLKYMKLFTEMERHLGIPVSYMIPDDIASDKPYDNFQGMSLKDMFNQYTGFVKKGNFDNAYELLDKYIKQKPEIDNNDVLKTYQKAKKDNPKLAEEIMESKLKQLEPIHSPEGLSERNKVGAKKKNRTSRNKP